MVKSVQVNAESLESLKASTRLTLLCIDLRLHVEMYCDDKDIGENVDSSDNVKYIGIFKRNFLRCLHEKEDDNQVGASQMVSLCVTGAVQPV